MGNILLRNVHTYKTKGFDQHILSIQKRLGKLIGRSSEPFSVIFVGETHNTIDERRRTQLFGFRPSSSSLLTVVERGMGLPSGGANLVVEPDLTVTRLSSFDEGRDQGVIKQIAAACLHNKYKAILILFGEDHEAKFRKYISSPLGHDVPDMVWHFYPSFFDHMQAVKKSFPAHDPRFAGYTLVGMISTFGRNKMDLAQLSEGIMPTQGTFNVSIMTPFANLNEPSDYAIFLRGALLGQMQHGYRVKSHFHLAIALQTLRDVRVLDVRGLVRPVPDDLKDDKLRTQQIEEFWYDAA